MQKISLRWWLVANILCFIVVVIISYYGYLHRPLRQFHQSVEQQRQLRQQFRLAYQSYVNWQALFIANKRIERQFQRYLRLVPKKFNKSSFIKAIAAVCDQYAVQLINLKPEKISQDKLIDRQPLQLQLRGTYLAILQVLRGLMYLPILSIATKVDLQTVSGKPKVLQMMALIQVFYQHVG